MATDTALHKLCKEALGTIKDGFTSLQTLRRPLQENLPGGRRFAANCVSHPSIKERKRGQSVNLDKALRKVERQKAKVENWRQAFGKRAEGIRETRR